MSSQIWAIAFIICTTLVKRGIAFSKWSLVCSQLLINASKLAITLRNALGPTLTNLWETRHLDSTYFARSPALAASLIIAISEAPAAIPKAIPIGASTPVAKQARAITVKTKAAIPSITAATQASMIMYQYSSPANTLLTSIIAEAGRREES